MENENYLSKNVQYSYRGIGVAEVETTCVSAKGQVVIPQQIRRELKLEKGARLVVYGKGNTIIMRKLDIPKLEEEFEEITKEGRKFAKEKGITIKDVLEDD